MTRKKKKIIVLGAGMVGSAIALDLAIDYDVTSSDINQKSLLELKGKVKTIRTDLSDSKKLKRVVENFDLVIGAVPGFMGFKTAKSVIEAGKNLVDISFFPEDAFHLNKQAQKKKVTAVVDCGVAPGLSNLIVGYHHQNMLISNFECYVGGLPKNPVPPFNYKAPFSPIDVIEEYTRPARIIVNNEEVIKEPLSEVEHLKFRNIGTLEAFNSDGLRSLLFTVNVTNMKEKTLRYPGHAEMMRLFRDAGFFSHQPVSVKGKKLRPIDFTTGIMFPQWKLEKGEKEFTTMRIIVEGSENGREVKYQYDLYDEYNEKTGISSMARTTGYTCTAAARLVVEGDYDQQGISPPEFIGARVECFDFIVKYLKERGIKLIMRKN